MRSIVVLSAVYKISINTCSRLNKCNLIIKPSLSVLECFTFDFIEYARDDTGNFSSEIFYCRSHKHSVYICFLRN